MSSWNWCGQEEKESLVIPRVDALAIYTNASGDIVIRQQNTTGEEDNAIIFPVAHASAVISAIRKAKSGE